MAWGGLGKSGLDLWDPLKVSEQESNMIWPGLGNSSGRSEWGGSGRALLAQFKSPLQGLSPAGVQDSLLQMWGAQELKWLRLFTLTAP